jgi:hypothetical protein
MDTAKTRTAAGITATILLILLIPAGLNYVPTLLATTTETTEDTTTETTEDTTTETTEDTSSASQDYQEFQSCLSDAEVDGTVSEQQIRDCFAPIYNTGTGTASDDTTPSTDSPSSDNTTPSTDSPSSDGDTDGADNGEESGGTE